MVLSLTNLRYTLTSFRTGIPYILYQCFQLLLSLIILIIAFLSDDLFRQTIVIWLEFVLLLSMLLDLFVIRLCTQGALWKKSNLKWKKNVFDTVVIAVFIATFIVLCATENKYQQGQNSQYSVLIQTDDIILIVIIVLRYTIQIFQILKTIRNTSKNIAYNKKMKDVDLNNNQNSIIIEQKNDAMQDQILRKKLEEREKYQKEKFSSSKKADRSGDQELEQQLEMK